MVVRQRVFAAGVISFYFHPYVYIGTYRERERHTQGLYTGENPIHHFGIYSFFLYPYPRTSFPCTSERHTGEREKENTRHTSWREAGRENQGRKTGRPGQSSREN